MMMNVKKTKDQTMMINKNKGPNKDDEWEKNTKEQNKNDKWKNKPRTKQDTFINK